MIAGAKVVAGPLSAAAASVRDTEGLATGHTEPVDPAVFLARIMTLHGSVDLAQHLDAPLPRGVGDRITSSSSARQAVRALVAERILELRDQVSGTFAEPLQRRNRLPTPAEVMAAIESGSETGEQVWAPCGQLVTRTLARVRHELAALREEIAAAVTALGPREARLERLDAALFEATAEGRAALEDRMVAALGRSFTRRPTLALLRRALDAGRDAVLGILEHDDRRLVALVAPPSHE